MKIQLMKIPHLIMVFTLMLIASVIRASYIDDLSDRNVDHLDNYMSFLDEQDTQTAQKKIFCNFNINDFDDQISRETSHTIITDPALHKTVKYLVLGNNKCSDLGIISLASAIIYCSHLQGLDIRGNSLSKLSFKALNISFSKCRQFSSFKYTTNEFCNDIFLEKTFVNREFMVVYLDNDDREIVFLNSDDNENIDPIEPENYFIASVSN